jgi:ribonuclease T1
MSRKILVRLLILVALIAVVWFVRSRQKQAQLPVNQPATEQNSPKGSGHTSGTSSKTKVPDYALDVLRYIRRNGEAPAGFNGGREFENREKKLPAKDAQNKRIRYSEWDVHKKVKGKSRGAERLVTGSDHSAWYSKDHYKTFMKIEE